MSNFNDVSNWNKSNADNKFGQEMKEQHNILEAPMLDSKGRVEIPEYEHISELYYQVKTNQTTLGDTSNSVESFDKKMYKEQDQNRSKTVSLKDQDMIQTIVLIITFLIWPFGLYYGYSRIKNELPRSGKAYFVAGLIGAIIVAAFIIYTIVNNQSSAPVRQSW